MAKALSKFYCKECGFESAKWMGQCPSCRAWNSFVEEPVVSASKSCRLWWEKGLWQRTPATAAPCKDR